MASSCLLVRRLPVLLGHVRLDVKVEEQGGHTETVQQAVSSDSFLFDNQRGGTSSNPDLSSFDLEHDPNG